MIPFVSDPDFTLLNCDVMDGLRSLPDESVHMCVTSPPYWGLRCYGVDGQLGGEATPEDFVAVMVEVFREVRRVLRHDGTLWLNLGDSYASQGGPLHPTHGLSNIDRTGVSRETPGQVRTPVTAGLKPKDLVGIPWRVAFALQADGWYLRSDIIWSKPNPMPESVTDRPTKAHEYVFLLTKSPRYFFDQEAVRERYDSDDRRPPHGPGQAFGPNGARPASGTRAKGPDRQVTHVEGGDGSIQHRSGERWPNPTGRNLRSVWEIATQPYPEAHFATFPEALPNRCIRAGTSEGGCCPECGAPFERQMSERGASPQYAPLAIHTSGALPDGPGIHRNMGGRYQKWLDDNPLDTVGWKPTCKHREPTVGVTYGTMSVPCTVLDPFMGSGTTALVARKLGRRSIGIELSREYSELCARRLQQQSLFAGDAA